jgi:acyl-CoA synthetase (AMP-forming)/AMP-acid ligase II
MPLDLLHTLTLGDVLREHRRSRPLQTAVVCGDTRLTFPELDQRVNRLATALLDRGAGAGSRVLWLGQNCHVILEGLLAAAKIGGLLCPANWRSTADELAHVLTDLDPAVVLYEPSDVVTAAREQAGSKADWVAVGAEYEALLAGGRPEDPDLPVDPASPVLAMYTAAFTGRPNAAGLSHSGLLAQDLAVALVQQVTADDVYLNCGPLFHIATFMTTLATFHLGGTNVFTATADAEDICRLVDAERCTGAFVMYPTIQKIVETNADGRYDLSSLVTMTMGNKEFAAMVSPQVTTWMAKPGGYGQTEVSGLLTFSAFGNGPMAPGRPSPFAQVRIVDEEGVELPPGETGEIVARGPGVMTGYLGDAEETARRQRDGWHHTNDLGRREADGTITFVGPKTDLIKTGVENVYPAEVEGALVKHPAVAEAVVIGVPDPVWDQNVKAVVRLHSPGSATADELVDHCRSLIASYKKPKVVDFVDAFPRLPSGVIDREAVKAAHGGGGTPGRG